MSEVEVRLDWREIDNDKMGSILERRFLGYRSLTATGLVAGITTAAVMFMLAAYAPPLTIGIFGTLILLLVIVTVRPIQKVKQAVSEAPIRQQTTTVIIGPEGIAAPGALVLGRIPWHHVIDVVETETALLILFSPVEYIPLADDSLPAGMPRAALAGQIGNWRKAAE